MYNFDDIIVKKPREKTGVTTSVLKQRIFAKSFDSKVENMVKMQDDTEDSETKQEAQSNTENGKVAFYDDPSVPKKQHTAEEILKSIKQVIANEPDVKEHRSDIVTEEIIQEVQKRQKAKQDEEQRKVEEEKRKLAMQKQANINEDEDGDEEHENQVNLNVQPSQEIQENDVSQPETQPQPQETPDSIITDDGILLLENPLEEEETEQAVVMQAQTAEAQEEEPVQEDASAQDSGGENQADSEKTAEKKPEAGNDIADPVQMIQELSESSEEVAENVESDIANQKKEKSESPIAEALLAETSSLEEPAEDPEEKDDEARNSAKVEGDNSSFDSYQAVSEAEAKDQVESLDALLGSEGDDIVITAETEKSQEEVTLVNEPPAVQASEENNEALAEIAKQVKEEAGIEEEKEPGTAEAEEAATALENDVESESVQLHADEAVQIQQQEDDEPESAAMVESAGEEKQEEIIDAVQEENSDEDDETQLAVMVQSEPEEDAGLMHEEGVDGETETTEKEINKSKSLVKLDKEVEDKLLDYSAIVLKQLMQKWLEENMEKILERIVKQELEGKKDK